MRIGYIRGTRVVSIPAATTMPIKRVPPRAASEMEDAAAAYCFVLSVLAVQARGSDDAVDWAGPHDEEDIAGLAQVTEEQRRLIKVAAVVDGGRAPLPRRPGGNRADQVVAVNQAGVALVHGHFCTHTGMI